MGGHPDCIQFIHKYIDYPHRAVFPYVIIHTCSGKQNTLMAVLALDKISRAPAQNRINPIRLARESKERITLYPNPLRGPKIRARRRLRRSKVARKKRYRDRETGEERVEIEYHDVVGMMNHKAAIHATVEAIRIQGRHPDKQAQGAGVPVSININIEWRDPDPTKVVNSGDHAEATESAGSEEDPPRVVIIGRK